MKLGEVGLLTNDVIKLANFYKKLLGVDNASNDAVHQTIIAEETMLTVFNDGTKKNNQNNNICLAFTVENMDEAYGKVLELGAEVRDNFYIVFTRVYVMDDYLRLFYDDIK